MKRSVGIDIGSQKTIIVSDDGERILTSTGSMTRPSVILFSKLSFIYLFTLLIYSNLYSSSYFYYSSSNSNY